MARSRFAVEDLKQRPFTLAEAREAGLTKWHLEFGPWRRIAPRTYASSRLRVGPEVLLNAARLRLPDVAAFSGLTAAWLHGLEAEPCQPIEATIPKGYGVSGKAGLRVSRARLEVDEVAVVRDLRVTNVPRTLRDLARRLTLTEAVVLVDAALHGGLVSPADLAAWIAARIDDRNSSRLRRAFEHAEPLAESPMETRLRMLLVLGGLPRPLAQVPIYGSAGVLLGRPDLYFPEHRLGLEYDGGTHRDSLTADDRRQNLLLQAGVRLLRFTAPDVYGAPTQVVAQVRGLLKTRAA